MSTLIEFDEVCKYYQMGDTLVKAADHVSFKINKGEFVAIVGQSGSGKSTCMNIIGCLDVPTEGTYLLDGRDVGKMSRRELASIRNEKLGFIFQQYNLLPKLTLLENVEVPLVYAGIPAAQRHATAKAALERVGLGNKLKNLPNQLSGGQQQRVSIARALALKRVILCRADHPSLSELRETPEHWPQILKKHPTVSVSRFEERDFPSMDSGLLAESIQDSAMLRVYSIATALGVLKEIDALAICGFTGAQYLIKLVPWLSCVQIPPSETDNPWLSLVWSQAIHDDPSAVWFRGLIKDWAKNISKDS